MELVLGACLGSGPWSLLRDHPTSVGIAGQLAGPHGTGLLVNEMNRVIACTYDPQPGLLTFPGAILLSLKVCLCDFPLSGVQTANSISQTNFGAHEGLS